MVGWVVLPLWCSRSPSWRSVPGSGGAGRRVTCYGRAATIVGTEGPETLTGTGGTDVIAGLGGDDTINGNGGRDFICPGDGADTVQRRRGARQHRGVRRETTSSTAGREADYVSYFDSPGAATVNLAAATGDRAGEPTR